MAPVSRFARAPHAESPPHARLDAANAALLIDFDNVTLGMRSDLAKQLKKLLDSDPIKANVTVRRAYADWRRYPQYIVPLSEASVDLIFAPAYGTSKKNATDIRMAIDGMELVFTRPEIGTFILLTGDSDFSSLVLKLKEYAKYVIGIGIQESTSDILVQNCDEYYSYTSLAGLNRTKTGRSSDPWECVTEALKLMASRGDAMRSDRLKQVMREISPEFNERDLGYSKFSRFLVEAVRKGLVHVVRGESGQYLVSAPGKNEKPRKAAKASEKRGGGRGNAKPAVSEERSSKALELLARVVRELANDRKPWSRDSLVKRRMLMIDEKFDEGGIGFSKFSKFLEFARGKGAIALDRSASGNLYVADPSAARDGKGPGPTPPAPIPEKAQGKPAGGRERKKEPRSDRRAAAPREEGKNGAAAADSGPAENDPVALGLPKAPASIQRYLSNSYRGVGVQTARKLVDAFGAGLFTALLEDPERVGRELAPARAKQLLDGWKADLEKRKGRLPESQTPAGVGKDAGEPG